MSTNEIHVRGETYLALETVAEIYRVEVVWLREVAESGLLGGAYEPLPTPCIAAVRLDHVATIVRLHRVLGLDLESIRDEMERGGA